MICLFQTITLKLSFLLQPDLDRNSGFIITDYKHHILSFRFQFSQKIDNLLVHQHNPYYKKKFPKHHFKKVANFL